MLSEFFPVIYNKYWYFSSYFGMYLFLPAINKGIALLTKAELKAIVISILSLFSFWHYYMNPKEDVFHLYNGYSLLWLLILYITGAYIGKFRPGYIGIKKYIYCCILLLIYILSSYFYYKILFTQSNNKGIIYGFFRKIFNESYDSTLKLIQSLSITLFLLQIQYNKYIAKIIAFLGPLTFSIYIIHMNKIFRENIINSSLFQKYRNDLKLHSTIILILMKSIKIFVFCCIIDYIRNLIFKFFQIRKICIFIENLVWKIL